MAETIKQVCATALTATLTTTLYTAPALTTTIVKGISVCNTNTTTTRNVTVDGAGGIKVLAAVPIAPGETRWFPDNATQPLVILTAAQTLRGGQDTGTDVNVVAHGVEIT